MVEKTFPINKEIIDNTDNNNINPQKSSSMKNLVEKNEKKTKIDKLINKNFPFSSNNVNIAGKKMLNSSENFHITKNSILNIPGFMGNFNKESNDIKTKNNIYNPPERLLKWEKFKERFCEDSLTEEICEITEEALQDFSLIHNLHNENTDLKSLNQQNSNIDLIPEDPENYYYNYLNFNNQINLDEKNNSYFVKNNQNSDFSIEDEINDKIEEIKNKNFKEYDDHYILIVFCVVYFFINYLCNHEIHVK